MYPVSYCQYDVANILLLESGNPVQTSELSYNSGLICDKIVDVILNTMANIHSPAMTIFADLVPNRLLLNMYLIPINLSMLITVMKKTEASLDRMDSVPATLQVMLDRHDSEGNVF